MEKHCLIPSEVEDMGVGLALCIMVENFTVDLIENSKDEKGP